MDVGLPPDNWLSTIRIMAQADPLAAAQQLGVRAASLMAAARDLDRMASELRQRAASNGGAGSEKQGMCDRVQARVIGPDGHVKQAIDTGAPSR